MIDATVCIPWRPQPDRLAAHERVRKFWAHFGFLVVEADSDHTLRYPALPPFNLSQARNNAVRQAISRHVIVADADTLPDIASVEASLDEFDGVTWPYMTFRHIPNRYADTSDLMSVQPDRTYGSSVGGILICKRETYWALGGMDEKFTGWGGEDQAFAAVTYCLSQARRQPGIVFSFNHFDGDPRYDAYRDMNPATNPGLVRQRLYAMCKRDPELMRELIR